MRHAAPLLALLFLAPAPGQFTARVVGVSDGDTLTVLTSDKQQVRVRLHGIDAPETGQAFGARAKQAASELALGKDVTIRERDRDRYGRTVADVTLPDGRSLNRELVGRGMAWWYREYAPRDRDLERQESEARDARRGLWADPTPTPPWAWRKSGGSAGSGVVGNRSSRLYHAANCRSVGRMKESNRAPFATAKAAEAAGYRKAGIASETLAHEDGPYPRNGGRAWGVVDLHGP